MIAEAIDRILELGRPLIVDHNGCGYTWERMNRIDNEMRADPIKVMTLSSMVTYIKEFKEKWKECPLMVHVESPTRVELISALDSDRKRETLMVAEAQVPYFEFGRYIDNESFIIKMQSLFVDDPNTDKAIVLQFAGTVTAGSVTNYGDDGVTQKATIKYGVASKAEAVVPSPCVLRPYRTFIEVEQPRSAFIFRMREGNRETVESALFEADGGAWKIDAQNSINEFLRKELEGTGIIVIS